MCSTSVTRYPYGQVIIRPHSITIFSGFSLLFHIIFSYSFLIHFDTTFKSTFFCSGLYGIPIHHPKFTKSKVIFNSFSSSTTNSKSIFAVSIKYSGLSSFDATIVCNQK